MREGRVREKREGGACEGGACWIRAGSGAESRAEGDGAHASFEAAGCRAHGRERVGEVWCVVVASSAETDAWLTPNSLISTSYGTILRCEARDTTVSFLSFFVCSADSAGRLDSDAL